MRRLLLSCCVWLVSSFANAAPFTLEIPVRCTIGQDCFIQNYVDQGKGDLHHDFRCRPLSYNGHTGTDIRTGIIDMSKKSPEVLASADGEVLRMRDGEEDRIITSDDPHDPKGCGNAVILGHAGGWETSYCHLRKDSIVVKPQQKVKAGDVLGQIGLSGQTEFPHVHLQVRNPQGIIVDPFNAQPIETGCSVRQEQLWSDKARQHLNINDAGVLAVGAASQVVAKNDVLMARHSHTQFSTEAPALVLWVLTYGLKKGDELFMILLAPNDETMVENRTKFTSFKAQSLDFIGKKKSKDAWAVGTYEGIVSASRKGTTLFDRTFTFEVK
ncbi:MAG: M23 family metallopeptidase [Alphaproteobacteria bacterium]|nr:MAG: M23 family metallopeptidase [Alphaproteobacteria bacterium]TAF16064.1 MAG: M23 family metallopeptidase [Alphaproteobacteria bacterium]TAF37523.1 MAG: M23 family metallopeptidase [Alphaproteobacteria bacterium]TAF75928.1 MAG: M23 family metallopeptidase [Alphaproteobacteria bacterium]